MASDRLPCQLEDLVREQDAWTAVFAVKHLEDSVPLHFVGQNLLIREVLVALLIACGGLAFVFWWRRSSGGRDQNGLGLKLPPVALGAIVAALMWFASSAAPALHFVLPGRPLYSVSLALLGAATSLSGVVSFRRAKTTVNPMKPEGTTSLVVSGIYRYTRNPMYLGFLLILLAWAAFLSNVLAFVIIPAFVLYMNRFQIAPEERALASLFAQEYPKYHAKVRRWI